MLYQNLTVRPVLFGVAGDKNTGKTTLMEELIRRLTNRGWKVAAIKHDGHDLKRIGREPIAGVIIMPEPTGLSYFRTGNTSSSRKKRIFPWRSSQPFFRKRM